MVRRRDAFARLDGSGTRCVLRARVRAQRNSAPQMGWAPARPLSPCPLSPCPHRGPTGSPAAVAEIASLTGTLSRADCHHLHLTVADAKCATYGGHATIGCCIRTTCEVAIGVLESVAFQVRHAAAARPLKRRRGGTAKPPCRRRSPAAHPFRRRVRAPPRLRCAPAPARATLSIALRPCSAAAL